MAKVRQGSVRISSTDPEVSVTALLLETPPRLSGGYGGWEQIRRHKRTALTEWRGRSGLSMSFGIMLDRFAAKRSVEAQVRTLERLARQPSDFADPPTVRIEGSVPHTDRVWVLQDVTLGRAHYTTRGFRSRQVVTLTLWEHISGELLELSKVKTFRIRGKDRKRRIYVVRENDSLPKIAARKLGDWTRWPEIASANDIRDPSRRLKVGRRLVIPRK